MVGWAGEDLTDFWGGGRGKGEQEGAGGGGGPTARVTREATTHLGAAVEVAFCTAITGSSSSSRTAGGQATGGGR